jgi:hypothetical protein
MNALWHERNKMPPKATLEERIQWHLAHREHCACREVPRSLLAARPDLFDKSEASRPSINAQADSAPND